MHLGLGLGLTAQRGRQIVRRQTDSAPAISGLQDLSASYGASVSINAALAASGSSIVYSMTGPDWLAINSSTGLITGTAPEADYSGTATVTVTNSGGSASDTFSVSVTAPAVAALASPALGAAYDFDFVADDYRIIPPHTGTQSSTTGATPIIYKQMLTQLSHLVENADGSLVWAGAASNPPIRRTTKGLHSFNGLDQQITSPRDLTNAAWVASGATAAKTQTGRDGTANAASLVSFTANGGTLTQTITNSAAARRIRLDIKRVSGSDPLEFSADGGATWDNFNPTGSGWGGWDHAAGQIVNVANNVVILRGQAGNSFVLDFVSLWGGRENIGSALPLSGRLTSKTLIGRDRIHHTITTTGGTTGEEGINIVRSLPTHGMWTEFSYSTGAALVATIGGIEARVDDTTQTIAVKDQASGALVTAPIPKDNGTGATMNRVMYHVGGGTLRLAVNGTLYSAPGALTSATTTHDFATSGAGSALEGFVRRLVWFDDGHVPTDAEMVAWTA